MASPMVVPFFAVNLTQHPNNAWMLRLAFSAQQGGIAFESQASVSPQRKKLAHQHRSRAVYSIFDHHPDSFTLFVGICRNRVGKSQRDHEGCLQTDPRHFHDCSHRYGRSRIADDEFFPQRPHRG